jgi:hypothetical protein
MRMQCVKAQRRAENLRKTMNKLCTILQGLQFHESLELWISRAWIVVATELSQHFLA